MPTALGLSGGMSIESYNAYKHLQHLVSYQKSRRGTSDIPSGRSRMTVSFPHEHEEVSRAYQKCPGRGEFCKVVRLVEPYHRHWEADQSCRHHIAPEEESNFERKKEPRCSPEEIIYVMRVDQSARDCVMDRTNDNGRKR